MKPPVTLRACWRGKLLFDASVGRCACALRETAIAGMSDKRSTGAFGTLLNLIVQTARAQIKPLRCIQYDRISKLALTASHHRIPIRATFHFAISLSSKFEEHVTEPFSECSARQKRGGKSCRESCSLQEPSHEWSRIFSIDRHVSGSAREPPWSSGHEVSP